MCTLADELVDKTHEAVRCVLRELSIWVVILKKTTGPMHEHDETMALKYLQWSQQVCSVDVLRNIVCEDVIRNFVQRWDESTNLTSPLELLLDTLPSMSQRVIEAETTLFLQLLYKSEFKHDFSEVLKDKYEKIVISAVDDEVLRRKYHYVDTNLDRVMVQLFNVPDITNKLIEDHNLLECFTTVFCDVISRCTKGDHSIVDVEHAAIESKVGTWL
jgi:E3 ubiquitin-protein ligase UBR1/E3 ubiquitin-protein ligase UBR3